MSRRGRNPNGHKEWNFNLFPADNRYGQDYRLLVVTALGYSLVTVLSYGLVTALEENLQNDPLFGGAYHI